MATDAPPLLSLEEATERLLSPGSPFELTRETVLGESMQVYKNRRPCRIKTRLSKNQQLLVVVRIKKTRIMRISIRMVLCL